MHRIGRTGRAGATGEAISLVCVDEHEFLRDIERLIKREIPKVAVPGFTPDPRAKAEPILQRQGRARQMSERRSGPPVAQHKPGGGDRGGGSSRTSKHQSKHASPRTGHAAPAATSAGSRKPALTTPSGRSPVVHRFGGRSR